MSHPAPSEGEQRHIQRHPKGSNVASSAIGRTRPRPKAYDTGNHDQSQCADVPGRYLEWCWVVIGMVNAGVVLDLADFAESPA